MLSCKDKAKELVDRFKLPTGANTKINAYVAKKCALICIDELRNNDEYLYLGEKKQKDYLEQVENEIKKL